MKQKTVNFQGQQVNYYSEPGYWVFKAKTGFIKFSKAKHASLKKAVKRFIGINS